MIYLHYTTRKAYNACGSLFTDSLKSWLKKKLVKGWCIPWTPKSRGWCISWTLSITGRFLKWSAPLVMFIVARNWEPLHPWDQNYLLGVKSSCHIRLCNPLWQPAIRFVAGILHWHATWRLPPPAWHSTGCLHQLNSSILLRSERWKGVLFDDRLQHLEQG